jgi:hypothetical protein
MIEFVIIAKPGCELPAIEEVARLNVGTPVMVATYAQWAILEHTKGNCNCQDVIVHVHVKVTG